MATAPRKTYRKPAAPKKVGAVDMSNNNYTLFGGSDFTFYSSGPNPG